MWEGKFSQNPIKLSFTSNFTHEIEEEEEEKN